MTKSSKQTTNLVGGEKVAAGFYWNVKGWEIVTLSGKGGVLPGDGATNYVKIPAAAMLGLAPAMGALYVMFLPLIGFAMLAEFAGKKAMGLARKGAEDVAGALVPEVRPGEAYLTGKKDGKATEKKADGEVEKLEAEIAAKREEKK